MSNNRANNQVVAQDDVSTVLIKAGINAAKKHYLISGGWVIGMLIGCFFTGLAVSSDQARNYDHDLQQIDTDALFKAQSVMTQDYQQYYQSKGWFGACDAMCHRYQDKYTKSSARYNNLKQKADLVLFDAKGKLGIFSEYGVEETRDLFWTRFNQGAKFTKRQTMWDAMFAGVSAMGRDEGLGNYLMRILLKLAINFTLGMFGALVGFMWTLWSVVSSFQPSLPEAILFFALAAMTALSFCATFVIGLYGAVAGTVYVAAKASENARLQGGGRQQRYVHGQQRRGFGGQGFGQRQYQQQYQQQQQQQQYRQQQYQEPQPPPYDHDHVD